MLITYQHQKWIFGVVLKEFRAIKEPVTVWLGKESFIFRPTPVKDLRNLLKHLDLDYPRDNDGKPLSYTKLTTKDMTKHIEWIVRLASNSGVELPHIAKAWEELLRQADIYKG